MRNKVREQPGATDLVERLQALERRLGSLQEDLAAGKGEARLTTLQSAVADLAAAQRDFQERLNALVAAVEKRLPDVADEIPEPRRPIPPAASGGPRTWAKKALRLALRGTLGTLRRVWDATHPHPPWGDEVRLAFERSAKPRRIRLAVAVPPGAEAALRAVLERQTDRDVEVRVADGIETSASALDTRPAARYVWSAAQGLADLPPTFLETVKLLLALEDLPFVTVAGPGGRAAASQWIVAREFWHPESILDLQALEKRAKRFPHRVLGKAAGGPALMPEDTPGPSLRHRLRQCGPYYVPASAEPRVFDHRLAPPPDPSPPDPAEGPAVLMLASFPLAGGLERTAASILGGLAAEARCLVVPASAPDAWGRSRLRGLEHLSAGVYPLDDFAEESRVEVLAHLIARHGVDRLLHLGADRGSPAFRDALAARFGDLYTVALPVPEPGRSGLAERLPAADAYLAASGRIEDELRRRGDVAAEKVWRLPPVSGETSPPAPIPGGEGSERLRRELRLPPDAVVVTMWSDLVTEKRPEDFVALAHRFRGDHGLRFLLAGDGPLGATLRDIESYFGLRNFVLEAPRRSLAEYLEATDVYCTTAEQELFPYGVLAALDRGLPVVAAAVDDLEEILGQDPSSVVVPFAGDLDGFESAIRSLSESGSRRAMDERARAAAGRRRGPDLVEVCRRALRLEPRAVAAGEAVRP